ncbi:MAG: SpoIIIJ-associated protein [Acidimicrobiales bacterium]|nr:MAG: SpoIIIJ-associated protein [Acidimicrobiales bacterium]
MQREGETRVEDVSFEDLGEVLTDFLEGLLDAFDLDADVEHRLQDDVLVVEVKGEPNELGILIGPRGGTLAAIEDLARTVVTQRFLERAAGKTFRIDVGGYRAFRRQMLEKVAGDAARKVLESGVACEFTPMNPADRKVVHDVVAAMTGVATVSEGEEPLRRVVIVPSDDQ